MKQNYSSWQLAFLDGCEDIVHDSLHAKEIEILVAMTVKSMPEQRQKIFIMSKLKGYSNAEIAEKSGLSVRTVERHLYLAVKTLRNVLISVGD